MQIGSNVILVLSRQACNNWCFGSIGERKSPYNKIMEAIKGARLYFYQNTSTEEIASEICVPRPTVSRLLKFAREEGLVNISIVDPAQEPRLIEKKITDKYNIKRVYVVQALEIAAEAKWLNQVAHYTARHLMMVFKSNRTLGVAWGITLAAVSKCLIKKHPEFIYISRCFQIMGINFWG